MFSTFLECCSWRRTCKFTCPKRHLECWQWHLWEYYLWFSKQKDVNEIKNSDWFQFSISFSMNYGILNSTNKTLNQLNNHWKKCVRKKTSLKALCKNVPLWLITGFICNSRKLSMEHDKEQIGNFLGFSDILERGESNSTEEKLIHLLHLDWQINKYENDYRRNFFNCLGINLIPSLLKFA